MEGKAMNEEHRKDSPERIEAIARLREQATQPGTHVMRYADEAMFQAQHVPLKPEVDVVDMTRNPLKVMAAPWLGYRGRYILPDQVTDDEAMAFAADALKSKIAAPLEWCQVALLIRGVSRDFTHQIVRQRTATFVQESMRFAVKDNTVAEIPVPWTIARLGDNDDIVKRWHDHVAHTDWFYNYLIGNGIPAEDARKALLIGTTTQLHYRTNLRDMINHAGLRLCSQAQAEWKEVWRAIVEAILNYGPEEHRWQQREITKLFRPVCYATGKCEFMGAADRWCVIRDRVEAHHAAGERPEVWLDINPLEPLHPEAARTDNSAWRM
jgi:flavin-dependent thymidylate synthase